MAMRRPLTEGRISGIGFLQVPSGLLAEPIISLDGTNAGTVRIRRAPNGETTGPIIFDFSGKAYPGQSPVPIECGSQIYYSISGTGAEAMLFEWIL